jgi:hypothetical protein
MTSAMDWPRGPYGTPHGVTMRPGTRGLRLIVSLVQALLLCFR